MKNSAFWIASIVLFFHLALALHFASSALLLRWFKLIALLVLFFSFTLVWYDKIRTYTIHTHIQTVIQRQSICAGVSTLPCLRSLSIRFVFCVFLLLFFSLDLFWGLFHFYFWLDFVAVVVAMLVLLLLMLVFCFCYILSLAQTQPQCIHGLLLKHTLYVFKGIQCGTHFV